MNDKDKELLKEYYTIDKVLTPQESDNIYKVYSAIMSSTFKPVIIKEMDEKRANIYRSLSNIWNPFIARVYSVFPLLNTFSPNQSNQHIFAAITECVGTPSESGKTLTLTEYVKKNGPLTEKAALNICSQICTGIASAHDNQIIHKDLKPDNIVLSGDYIGDIPQVKIIDFGVSEYEAPTTTVLKTSIERAGTEGYSPHDKKITPKWDVYSIGCILNYMLTGHTIDFGKFDNNWHIRKMIDGATNDFSIRYKSANTFIKLISHELGREKIDRIPILRSLPGFRSHTLWKSTIALAYYFLTIFVVFNTAGLILLEHNFLNAWIRLTSIALCFIVPVFIVFDPIGLIYKLKFLKQIRDNSVLSCIVKLILTALSVLCSLLLINTL